MPIKKVATNRSAKFEYHLLEHFEAGIVLHGTEIKSIRAGNVSIKEAYVQIDSKEGWLINSHISPYEPASRMNHDPKRRRKLLLNKREIRHLWAEVRQKNLTIVPVEMYLKDGRVKVDIALAKGKKMYDKRQEISKRDIQREIERTIIKNRKG